MECDSNGHPMTTEDEHLKDAPRLQHVEIKPEVEHNSQLENDHVKVKIERVDEQNSQVMSRRPTYCQLETLTEFLEEHIPIAQGRLRTSSAKAETKRKWASIAVVLNALGGAHKDGVGWAKYWTEKKCALKKICAQHNNSMRQTGGGPAAHIPPLSDLDKRLIDVMGGFSTGDPGLSVDPFQDTDIVLEEREAEEPAEVVTVDNGTATGEFVMSRRPTYCQLETLTEFLEEHIPIAQGRLRTSSAKAETKRKWASIAVVLNALGGAHKDGVGWAKYWTEKKCALKKICAQHNNSMRQTGGGPAAHIPPLSDLDKRLIDVMGGFSTGDPGLSVDPFPDTDIVLEEREEEEPAEVVTVNNGTATGEFDAERDRSPVRPHTPVRSSRRRGRGARAEVEGDFEALAQMEARRIDAEHITAEALRSMAAAQQDMARALTSLATAITQLLERQS